MEATMKATMKAIVYETYGTPDVLELRDVDIPTVGDDEILVRVRAAAVNPLDWHFLNGTPYLVRTQTGLRRPKQTTLGVDVAGTVEAVGSAVTEFGVGDDVFGGANGSFAEFATTRAKSLVSKPAHVSFEQAAAVPIAALTALQCLRDKADVQAGQRVLINGASGGVGTYAVQIAKSFGADVTGVCSTRNVEMVRSIGADHVIDYTAENFTETATETADGGDQRYDVIIDAIGNHPMGAFRRSLTPKGVYVAAGDGKSGNWIGPLVSMATVMLASIGRSQSMKPMLAKITKDDLTVMQGLLESEAVTSVIDRRYELADAADALRHQGAGHAQGKTVINVS